MVDALPEALAQPRQQALHVEHPSPGARVGKALVGNEIQRVPRFRVTHSRRVTQAARIGFGNDAVGDQRVHEFALIDRLAGTQCLAFGHADSFPQLRMAASYQSACPVRLAERPHAPLYSMAAGFSAGNIKKWTIHGPAHS